MRAPSVAILIFMSLLLAGCAYKGTPDPEITKRDKEWLPKVPKGEPEQRFARYLIDYRTKEKPGTIVVDTQSRYLYYVLPDGKAIRYGVAVGDEYSGWTGETRVGHKAEWPAWNPTPSLMRRFPSAGPTPGGPWNPLGARALYLYEGNHDTLYRIHGTNQPEEIGRMVSSGCIRMRNIDVIDLYNRAGLGTRVIVR
ncbi:MAG: L,D-transpeptidase [Methylobacteriaceae bacterium]|jgi:lipoprotein-anchoring transpeptidase ErfK/SrfK|nr:L,D-transpeptidase [Methylobacteriaceae bacterium]